MACLAAVKVEGQEDGGQRFDLSDSPAPGSPEFGRLLESRTGSAVRCGNRVEVLRNGAQIFPAMVQSIRSAQATIDFSTYIYWAGCETIAAFGEVWSKCLCRGAGQHPARCRGQRAKMDRELVERLREAGATVQWFRPASWYTLDKANSRLHRRLLIVDGSVGFTGGVGVGEEWTGDAEDPEHWRETHVRVQGPAVRDLLGGFQESWAEVTQRILTGRHLPDIEGFEDSVDVPAPTPPCSRQACASSSPPRVPGSRHRRDDAALRDDRASRWDAWPGSTWARRVRAGSPEPMAPAGRRATEQMMTPH